MVAGEVLFADGDISIAGDTAAALAVEGFIVGLVGSEAVDVAVVHAEGGGNEHGVVNLEVGCTVSAGGLDIG